MGTDAANARGYLFKVTKIILNVRDGSQERELKALNAFPLFFRKQFNIVFLK
jgi:hypothetical protein